jgi:AAHS family 4-hydroxybenzoate transporter-like MFS transporter
MVYWVCGGLAVVFSGVLALLLPESARYMVIRHTHREALAATIRRLAPGLVIGPETQFFLPKATERQPWPGELFRDRRGAMTVALWAAYGLNLMGLIFVTSWMPTVFADSGISISRSVVATSIYQSGGAAGSVLFGWILDRKNGILQLAGLCLVAVPIIAGIGHATFLPALLLVLVFLAGICIVGTQTGLNALSGSLYPSYLRSTGAGWTSGVGRIGAIIGPLLGGVLISLQLPLASIFLLLAIPSFCVAACLFAVNFFRPGGRDKAGPVIEPSHTASFIPK